MCISRFGNRTAGEKDPLLSRRRPIQRFSRHRRKKSMNNQNQNRNQNSNQNKNEKENRTENRSENQSQNKNCR